MSTIRKTYVEYFYPGAIVAETSVMEVATREPHEVEVPAHAHAFRFFDMVAGTTDEGIEVASKPLDYSPMHFFGGRVFTLAQIEAEVPGSETLLINMRCMKLDRVVRTRFGYFIPFGKEDILLDVADTDPAPTRCHTE